MIQDSTENVKIIRISYLQVFPQERHVFSLSEQKNCQSWKSSWHKSSQETSERKLTLRTRKTCSNAQQRSDQVVCISCCRLKVYFELKMPRILSRSSVHRNDKRSSWAGSTSRPADIRQRTEFYRMFSSALFSSSDSEQIRYIWAFPTNFWIIFTTFSNITVFLLVLSIWYSSTN